MSDFEASPLYNCHQWIIPITPPCPLYTTSLLSPSPFLPFLLSLSLTYFSLSLSSLHISHSPFFLPSLSSPPPLLPFSLPSYFSPSFSLPPSSNLQADLSPLDLDETAILSWVTDVLTWAQGKVWNQGFTVLFMLV